MAAINACHYGWNARAFMAAAARVVATLVRCALRLALRVAQRKAWQANAIATVIHGARIKSNAVAVGLASRRIRFGSLRRRLQDRITGRIGDANVHLGLAWVVSCALHLAKAHLAIP